MSTTTAPVFPEAPSTTSVPSVSVKPKAEPRAYVVLRKQTAASPSSALTWEFLRNIDANSQEQAVRKAAEILLAAGEEGTITLVAVTAARFVPVTVTAEIKTQIKLS